ncbi:metallophosphoesterase family protein [Chthonobacter rhizosphaerae]|uniref:metallophosphoesterase family protein n=1 Tax=Chthonobacter rhizosphaerae TaxID=2735553 RepID=UPI0015EEC955|nr:metallophosphoesterase family protein [Chthonobacter rhizosphaerae]
MRKLLSWLSRWSDQGPEPVQPVERYHTTIEAEDALVYAVGDVHGCLAELMRLETLIAEDAKSHAGPKYIVMTGDYVDRGPNSAGVIEYLLGPPPAGFQRICLAGNHDASMLNFLTDRRGDPTWIRIGGAETLRSYGLESPRTAGGRFYLRTLAELAAAKVPPEHRQFLEDLRWTARFGRYLIVHAGIRPGIGLADQRPVDLLWIRDEFIHSSDPLDFVVVHGHTPVDQPLRTDRRIAIDTAAYATGRLTAVKLQPDQVSFLTATAGMSPFPSLLAAGR